MKTAWYSSLRKHCNNNKKRETTASVAWLAICSEGTDEVASCRKRNTCAANGQTEDRPYVCECEKTYRRQEDLTSSVDLTEARCCHSPGLPRAPLSRFIKCGQLSRFKTQLCLYS